MSGKSPQNTGNPDTGISLLIKSFGYAINGIMTMVKTQPNARLHAVSTVLVIGFGFFFEVSLAEWCLLIICTGGVWAAEAFNTALEALTDLVSPDTHPLAGKAKDAAAGAVLLFAIASALVAAIIFLPKIWALVQSAA